MAVRLSAGELTLLREQAEMIAPHNKTPSGTCTLLQKREGGGIKKKIPKKGLCEHKANTPIHREIIRGERSSSIEKMRESGEEGLMSLILMGGSSSMRLSGSKDCNGNGHGSARCMHRESFSSEEYSVTNTRSLPTGDPTSL
ncbi:hypothetical protein Tco_1301157 [Tanacetum coccineum]